jgi:hypothetical protein
MPHTHAGLKAEAARKINNASARSERAEMPTQTDIEDRVLKLRGALGEYLAHALVVKRPTAEPIPLRRSQSGRPMPKHAAGGVACREPRKASAPAASVLSDSVTPDGQAPRDG